MSTRSGGDGPSAAAGLVRGDSALIWQSISELARLIERREVSPVDVVRAELAHIERLNPTLRAMITVTADKAIAEARAAEAEIVRGGYRGPLHGVPVAHKDTYKTEGVRTTAHSRLYLDYVPAQSAALVEAWAGAGAITIGKANTYELASGREQAIFGIPRNPWKLDRVTGGSSSGSGGGVAAGFFYGASGTDAGGSIRAPAAHCGVVGFRPTFGLVNRRGTLGSNGSTSCGGPLARTVTDVALLMMPLAHSRAGFDTSLISDLEQDRDEGLKGVTVGVPAQYFMTPAHCSSDVLEKVSDAITELARLGAEVVEVSLPHVELVDDFYEVLVYAESSAVYGELVRSRESDFGPATKLGILVGTLITAAEYLLAQRLRTLVQADFDAAFKAVDLIVSPTAYTTARRPEEDATQRRPHPRRPMGLSGGPSVSVPCGLTAEGLPVGLQVAAKPWDDGRLLRLVRAYERARPRVEWPLVRADAAPGDMVVPAQGEVTSDLVRERYAALSADLRRAVGTVNLDGVEPAVKYHPPGLASHETAALS